MKIHAPRKGSLAYSRRHARKLIPVSSPKQAAVWGTKVGITSVVYQNRVLPVTIIQLAQVEKKDEGVTVKTRFVKPFLRSCNVASVGQIGSYVKVTSLTKGKGFIGVIKMRGLKLGKRKKARANKQRHVGCLAPRTGNTRYTTPYGGKKMPETRTNCAQILPVNIPTDKPYTHYGFIKNAYLVLKGSIPGNIRQVVKILPRTNKRDALLSDKHV